MRTDRLDYQLPEDLIAQQPAPNRSRSRLLVINRSANILIDSTFDSLIDYLNPGDCLVLNDTKVLPGRFFVRRKSGAKLEGLFISQQRPGVWEVMLRGSRKVKVGEDICLYDKNRTEFCSARLVDKNGDGTCLIQIDSNYDCESILDQIGYPPLPPYIVRDDDPETAAYDKIRYQTVYAKNNGAIAAPTAGLHFTKELLEKIKRKGIAIAYVTLHVGTGTFKPVNTDRLEDYKIHEEWFSINSVNVDIVNNAKKQGKRVIAVGTTSVRVLETAADEEKMNPFEGTTDLFIMPGYKFKAVDALVTNFHLPRTTLLALVAGFTGLDEILTAYKYAIEKKYRFFSYGDAMLII